MNAQQRAKIIQLAASEAHFVMKANEGLNEAMYRAITAILYLAFEILHPEDPFPSLGEVEFSDNLISVEFYWDGELVLGHDAVMAFCKARKCTLAQIRNAFRAHDFSGERLREEEEKHLERHSKGVILLAKDVTQPPVVKLVRPVRRLV